MPDGRHDHGRTPNEALRRLADSTGASHKSLALRVNQLAAANGLSTQYTHTSWANWTRRGIQPQPPIRPLIAQALGERLGRPVAVSEIGLDTHDGDSARIGLDFPRALPQAITAATQFWNRVDRRDFLTTGLTMTGYTTPVRRWLTTPADPHAGHQGSFRVGPADITELVAAAEDARRWDSQYGGGNWRTSALAICLKERATPLLHGRYTDVIGKRLFTATAQLSRLAGWTAFDAGHHGVAQRHYIQALRHARAAADIPLGGYILVCMALQASLRGFHDDAIDMTDAAFQRARHATTPRVLAFYRLIDARAHARAGDQRAAEHALLDAERLLDQARTGSGDDPAWIDFFTHARLAADATEIYRDLNHPAHAFRWNTHATAPTDQFARSYALRLTVLASAHLQGPRPELHAALDHANNALDVLSHISSARAIDYTHDLLNRLTPWHNEPTVRDLAFRVHTELPAA